MASRRQKFKPLAGIQKARRAQNTVSESITKDLIKVEDTVSVKIEDNTTERSVTTEETVEATTTDDAPTKPSENTVEPSDKPSDPPEEKPQVTAAPRPLRRSIKPAVVIPDRRRKVAPTAEVKAEENSDKVPVAEPVEKIPQKAPSPATPLTPLKLKQENSDNIQKPITPEDTFKSPFLSPSISHQKRPEFVYNPLDQQNAECSDDPTKSPVYSNKVRQRIRPTPYFGRRNSVQGAISESDDESNKRQRHLSTSSSHSNYNINNNATPKIVENTRMRTESVCSNISEAGFQTFSKPKRIARSEEFQRIANAKKEFHQRFNGKTPDKQHLTMYDMIYYNPVTNPLKNPASKSNDIKDRRSSSASSVHSVASIRSIKSEAKTSEDSMEAEMAPVPQLKLGPNGEIVLDEKSLVIETTGDKEARVTLANADIVYDDEFSGSTGFYKRQKRTREWDAHETIKFYRCLHSVGTDFSLMLMLFPNRSRRDLKLKFKKEEKTNLALINKALLHPKEFNIDELKVDLEREEKELEQKKREWEELKQKHAKEKREQSRLLKQRNRKSIAARNIAGSDTIYDHEFAVAPRKNRKLGAFVANTDSSSAFTNAHPKPTVEEKPTITVIKNEYLMPNAEKKRIPIGPLSPQDILNMDIVFADTENADAQQSQVTSPTNTVPATDGAVTSSDNSFVFVDCQSAPIERTKVKVENDDRNVDNEESLTEMEQDDECDSNNESIDSLSMKELAVVASHSVDDPNNVIYEVYAVSATTGELSDKPLDLPPDVVEQIRLSIGV
ncbi:hypothetical protein HA402_005340 [Bradysia odoriphaga]|nr:hypothetical protein HA402_005340 [Bradysia odoriphaga]